MNAFITRIQQGKNETDHIYFLVKKIGRLFHILDLEEAYLMTYECSHLGLCHQNCPIYIRIKCPFRENIRYSWISSKVV